MTKQELQRTTLKLDPEQHKRLKILAIQRDTTLTDLIAEALEQYLDREERQTGKRTR